MDFPLQYLLRVNVSDLLNDKLMAHYLQHVSVQRYQLQVTQINKIATQRYWVVAGLYINEITFVQLISTRHNYLSKKPKTKCLFLVILDRYIYEG